ncbi:hypothetical protein GF339_00920, partial [candidate division KSB3 bacterium]|nr:hypothetical protein [candidate division KSB3 bacterium]MBD3323111.1 hypothetical protein [candidate division KSB3 bacterium]
TTTCWHNMLAGQSGIRAIKRFNPGGCRTKIGGELPEEYSTLEKARIPRRMFKQTLRATRLGFLCAQQAVEDSALQIEQVNPDRCAVIIGSSGAGEDDDPARQDPSQTKFKIVREMLNALPAWISIKYGFHGRSYTVSAADASGSYAIGSAYALIRSGQADLVITGGVDTLLTRHVLSRCNALGLLAETNDLPEKSSRPFDRDRTGFVLSDGGCVMILERREHANARSARIYARLTGYGATSRPDDGQPSESHIEAMAHAMQQAIQDAHIPPKRIGYVNAHGLSSPTYDRWEAAALKSIFQAQPPHVTVSALKSMLGHTMGACGAIACAMTALSLTHQQVTPTINYVHPDPECTLDNIPTKMREAPDLQAALSNTFGLSGHNASFVVEKYV